MEPTNRWSITSTPDNRISQCIHVLTDQGTEFQGEFQVLCDKVLIDHRTTSRDHPEADGLAKRVVQTVKRALRKYGLQKAT